MRQLLALALFASAILAGCLSPVPSSDGPVPDESTPLTPPAAAPPPAVQGDDVGNTSGAQSPVQPAPPPESVPSAIFARHAPSVVIVQPDSGINPYHPCWRTHRTPTQEIPGLPNLHVLQLDWRGTYLETTHANDPILEGLQASKLYWLNGTRLLFWPGTSPNTILDDDGHGSHMSTIAACEQYGFGGDVWLVVMKDQTTGLGSTNGYDDQIRWAAKQDWIDIMSLSFGSIYPTPVVDTAATTAVQAFVDAGKLAVAANGNGLANGGPAFPGEAQETTNAKGVLAVGANDNNGWIYFSNYDPHVVSDGYGTPAGAFQGDGSETAGGTSAAAARVAGYAANALLQVRTALNTTDRDSRCLVLTTDQPTAGPLHDGCLTAAELHAAIRWTANPASHDSKFDGEAYDFRAIPIPPEPAALRYPFLGYGEVSEHTLPDAVAVILGLQAPPDRSTEDAMYEASERLK